MKTLLSNFNKNYFLNYNNSRYEFDTILVRYRNGKETKVAIVECPECEGGLFFRLQDLFAVCKKCRKAFREDDLTINIADIKIKKTPKKELENTKKILTKKL